MSFVEGDGDHRDLHSFPTRRSSDLGEGGEGGGNGREGAQRHGRPVRAKGPMCGPVNSEATSSRNASTSRVSSGARSEEHTSELQSLTNLVCRLLLEKKKCQTIDQLT